MDTYKYVNVYNLVLIDIHAPMYMTIYTHITMKAHLNLYIGIDTQHAPTLDTAHVHGPENVFLEYACTNVYARNCNTYLDECVRFQKKYEFACKSVHTSRCLNT